MLAWMIHGLTGYATDTGEPGQSHDKWATGTNYTWTSQENLELTECCHNNRSKQERIHDTYEGTTNGLKMDIHTNYKTSCYPMLQCSKEEAALTTFTETDTSLGVELLSAISSMWMISRCMLRVNKTLTS